MQILFDNNGVFEEVNDILEIFKNLNGVKGNIFSKTFKIIDDIEFSRAYIQFIEESKNENCKKNNNYYEINKCIAINVTISDSSKILYNEEAVVIKNTGKECMLKINVMFLEDNHNGDGLDNVVSVNITLI